MLRRYPNSNSDADDDDVAERHPLDPTRKLERDIQKLIKIFSAAYFY